MIDEVEATVRRAQRRDPDAMAELYRMYASRVYGYLACRVPDRARLDDLTAEVFARMVERISSYRGPRRGGTGFTGWLFTLARNIWIDDLRRRGRRPEDPVAEMTEVVEASGNLYGADEAAQPHVLALQMIEFGQVQQALLQLTDTQREVIQLRFAGELSSAEVAEVLEMTVGAVKAAQHRAMHALRRTIGIEVLDGT